LKIHHLNCGSLFPPLPKIQSIVYCLLVETSQGLVLVDSGFGTNDYQNPTKKMSFFLRYMGVPKLLEETAIYQVQQLGYRRQDVKHIIQTHLHIDHAGGLVDFPEADVHVYEKEYQAIQNPRGLMEFAYIQAHWTHQPHWIVERLSGEKWFGFDAVLVLTTPETDFYLIPLPGHTRGHCGVAIGKPGNWLIHCGDAASPYHQAADLHNRGKSNYVLNFFPSWIANHLMGDHTQRLRKLLQEHGTQIKAISSHDRLSFLEHTSQDQSNHAEID
jgi:glyoxylase-like metal-dependent hydrolase (beta-lactamase superfamily II)